MRKIISNLIDEVGDSNLAIRDSLILLASSVGKRSLKGKSFIAIDIEKMRESIGIKEDTSIIRTERVEVNL